MDSDEAERTATQKAHELGRAIVTRCPYQPEETVTLNTVMERHAVSRAMAREMLQVLHHKRLVRLQPRVGAAVRKAEDWDYFDHDIMAWRLDSDDHWQQLESLTQLREAIEPRAASLAARNPSTTTMGRELVQLSRELRTLGQDPVFGLRNEAGEKVRDRYSQVDADFHTALLGGSGNEMFFALAAPVKIALEDRIKQSWVGAADPYADLNDDTDAPKPFPLNPEPAALWLHCGLAHAVMQRCPEAAETFARAILAEIRNGSLEQPVLRYALRLALAELDPRRFQPDEWAGFRDKMIELIREPNHR